MSKITKEDEKYQEYCARRECKRITGTKAFDEVIKEYEDKMDKQNKSKMKTEVTK